MTVATKARQKDKPTKRANIVEAMDGIFKPWFPGDTWGGWIAVLKAMDGLGPHVRFRRVQTLVREGGPLVKLRNSSATPPRVPAAPLRSPGSST